LPSNTHMKFELHTEMATSNLRNLPLRDFGSFCASRLTMLRRQPTKCSIDQWSNQEINELREIQKRPKTTTLFTPITAISPLQLAYWSRMELHKVSNRLIYFCSIGILFWLLACINVIKLATARAIKRMKESESKVNGGQKRPVITSVSDESIFN